MTKEIKQALLAQLYAPYKKCIECPLGTLGRINVVFGEGNPDARLMIIGEAPGRDEDIKGRPFIGRSGKLLTTVLELADIKREDVFITNVVKCRPPENRNPLPIEAKTCKELLLFKQIEIIQPDVICTLGAVALEGLLGHPVKISQIRGVPTKFKNTLLIPTFHPAYILRNPSKMPVLYEDIKKAHEYLR
jgi:DNA polymerase